MARVSADSDNDIEQSASTARRGGHKSSKKAAPSESASDVEAKTPEEQAAASDQAEEEEEEEPEYEIAQILEAKRGVFPDGRIGYFVRWKGYTEEEDSWVDENDAGGATALIEEYWRNQRKGKGSNDTKVVKRPRKSVADDQEEESSSKKRGRKSVTKDDEEDSSRTSKKVKKSLSGGKNQSAKPGSSARASSPEAVEEYGNMAKYMKVPDWSHLVAQVDTVEKGEGDDLTVYFSLIDGRRMREASSVCRKRFPEKLLAFYESNLRWKAAEDAPTDNS